MTKTIQQLHDAMTKANEAARRNHKALLAAEFAAANSRHAGQAKSASAWNAIKRGCQRRARLANDPMTAAFNDAAEKYFAALNGK